MCPYTFVRTRLRLEELPLGTELAVIVDYRPAVENIPRSAREWGQDVLGVEPEGDQTWRIRLRKVVE